ncbi:hypothetical protein [Nocardia sp. NPDC059228]|uniref:hypothetical protein n=1 Tax=Nocardia sp. NPDC059228 TaxID=3346777 RepID=UPI0036BF58A6
MTGHVDVDRRALPPFGAHAYGVIMATIVMDDLPAPAADVLRRRARRAGLSMVAYIRAELIQLARTRVPLDAVVEFLEAERPGHPIAEIDADAMALIGVYELSAEIWSVFSRRAGAAGMPMGGYVRQELMTLARRTTIEDVVLEFLEVQDQNPGLLIDMDAVIAATRYARAE